LFDRICFFENGRIISVESVEELLRQSVEFQALWAEYGGSEEEPLLAV